MAKRGRRKRTKPDADKSGSGPGRPSGGENEPAELTQWHDPGGKRQRVTEESDEVRSEEDMKQDVDVNIEDDTDPTQAPPLQMLPLTSCQPAVTAPKTATSGDEAGSSIIAAVPEENGFVVKSEPFDPSYEMGDLLLNGSVDSIMDMPLFHEVDSLMNIKHEDHLNDTIFYLPMSYPLDSGVKVEVDSMQVAEATRTLANELAMPNALVYVTPDSGVTGKSFGPQQSAVKHELSDQGSAELRAHLKAPPVDSVGTGESLTVNGALSSKLANGHVPFGKHENHFVNGYGSAERAGSGKAVGKRGSKKSGAQDKNSEPVNKSNKKVNGARSRQTSPSTSSLSDSSGEESLSSPPRDNGELGAAVPQAVLDDRPEIDRFVICSDHTMECVLCAFTTDSYSAFKSHIICSHPCWRITKKLSKNRLLVERSIKTSTSIFSGSSPSDHAELRTTKAGSTTTTLHAKNDQELQKVLRKYDKNPRKRQLFERNKRLFKCTVCLRLFVFEGSVVNHVTDQHGLARPYEHIHISNDHGQKFGPIYRCNQKNCFFSCESEYELERHSIERHTQVMYRCQLCGYTADSAEAVRTHGICMHQQQLMCFDTPL